MVNTLQESLDRAVGQAVIDGGGQIEDHQGDAKHQETCQVPAIALPQRADDEDDQPGDAQPGADAVRDAVGQDLAEGGSRGVFVGGVCHAMTNQLFLNLIGLYLYSIFKDCINTIE